MSRSYTADNPVAFNAACEPCGVTVATDNPVPELVEMFNERHRSCNQKGEK